MNKQKKGKYMTTLCSLSTVDWWKYM